MYSTISREEIKDNKSSQDITKSVSVNINVDKHNEKKRRNVDYSTKIVSDIDDAEKTSLSDETLTDRYFIFKFEL
jgi:hypothetical protein